MPEIAGSDRQMVTFKGSENCTEVFAFLGLEHPDDETDHGKIHYEVDGRTVTATRGDVICRDDEGALMAPFKPSSWLLGKGIR